VSRYPKYINKQVVDRLDQALATNPNSYLVLTLYLVNTIYKDEALTDAL
jgi:hypothetical protein